jgi:hypothetical protein
VLLSGQVCWNPRASTDVTAVAAKPLPVPPQTTTFSHITFHDSDGTSGPSQQQILCGILINRTAAGADDSASSTLQCWVDSGSSTFLSKATALPAGVRLLSFDVISTDVRGWVGCGLTAGVPTAFNASAPYSGGGQLYCATEFSDDADGSSEAAALPTGPFVFLAMGRSTAAADDSLSGCAVRPSGSVVCFNVVTRALYEPFDSEAMATIALTTGATVCGIRVDGQRVCKAVGGALPRMVAPTASLCRSSAQPFLPIPLAVLNATECARA